MNRTKRLVAALVCVAAASGSGTAYAQLGDGSVGTVQVAPPSASGSVDAVPDPGVGASVSVQPQTGGTQTADGSVGTVQVGSGTQNATGSAGTVQASVPGTTAGATSSPSADGTSVDPNTSFSANVAPGSGGMQTASDSFGTAQIGNGSQTAGDSIGTAQIAQPGASAEGSFQGPLRPDMPDGLVVLPESSLSAGVDPAEGGPQNADNSVGTLQVGGGEQTASNSALTGQVAVPSVDAEANVGGSGPTDSASFAVTPGGGGPQTADSSAGTVQVGGGGDQTAADSVGTGQVATPGLSGDAALNREEPAAGSSAALTPSGGDQLADNSAGTVQVGGNGSQTAVDSVGTGQVAVPAVDGSGGTGGADVGVTPTGGDQTATDSVGTVQVGGGGGSFFAAGTPPSGTPAATAAATPAASAPLPESVTEEPATGPGRSGAPLGVRTPLNATGSPAALPFTGASLLAVVLFGLGLLLMGLALRRRVAPRAA